VKFSDTIWIPDLVLALIEYYYAPGDFEKLIEIIPVIEFISKSFYVELVSNS